MGKNKTWQEIVDLSFFVGVMVGNVILRSYIQLLHDRNNVYNTAPIQT